jgi:hypothetical protein
VSNNKQDNEELKREDLEDEGEFEDYMSPAARQAQAEEDFNKGSAGAKESAQQKKAHMKGKKLEMEDEVHMKP